MTMRGRWRDQLTLPAWCRAASADLEPWFRVSGTVYFGSYGSGRCRAWADAQHQRLVASCGSWLEVRGELAALHGVDFDAVELRPTLPPWVKR